MKQKSGKYQRSSRGKGLIRLLLVLLCLSALLFGGMLFYAVRSQRQFRQLARQVHTETAAIPVSPTETATDPAATETTLATQETQTATEATQPQLLPQYQALFEENPDFFGWLTIPDTKIDYPVMHSPDDPEKYLHADFDGQYSFAGTPFVDASCDLESDNILIYAHNMLDGSMFRSLLNYQEKTYWQKHPVILFNTLYEEQEYEVLAAFYDRVYYKTETCFKFYQFINAAGEADFDDAIANFREKSLYDTGVSAAYGDKLITLVTCAYHTDNGRFVVVARRK